MKYNRFDHEQALMNTWQIVEDLDMLLEGILEHDMTQDQIANVVLGMKELYNLKFNKLWDQFERSIR